ncbi:Conserved_hypothetical protein [Hexamita inflata]|uniref:Uncharacterized protein n=1 Tax=Hexamita inflata TaxID=28002 RepID=A0AA86RI72_9EUKA|nr:Conserved hypothetical protein [Hexamita inflata]CAI9914689.1 Conserved hypothetical protein [Hexamita inflata]CAI9925196.1 Conserved hypothetical protein [Hexamita inflata]CAI9967445.1 Conserved hypothetical protein [Hexamita inflata]CAI9973486.1 Conserved hypothetical protein [Hexamita inflata]
MNSQQLNVLYQVKKQVDELTHTDNSEQQVFQYVTDHMDQFDEQKIWKKVKFALPKGHQDQDPKKVYIDATKNYRKPITDLHDAEMRMFTWQAVANNERDVEKIVNYLTKIYVDQMYWKLDILDIVKQAFRKTVLLRGQTPAEIIDDVRDDFREEIEGMKDIKQLKLFNPLGRSIGNTFENFMKIQQSSPVTEAQKALIHKLVDQYTAQHQFYQKLVAAYVKKVIPNLPDSIIAKEVAIYRALKLSQTMNQKKTDEDSVTGSSSFSNTTENKTEPEKTDKRTVQKEKMDQKQERVQVKKDEPTSQSKKKVEIVKEEKGSKNAKTAETTTKTADKNDKTKQPASQAPTNVQSAQNSKMVSEQPSSRLINETPREQVIRIDQPTEQPKQTMQQYHQYQQMAPQVIQPQINFPPFQQIQFPSQINLVSQNQTELQQIVTQQKQLIQEQISNQKLQTQLNQQFTSSITDIKSLMTTMSSTLLQNVQATNKQGQEIISTLLSISKQIDESSSMKAQLKQQQDEIKKLKEDLEKKDKQNSQILWENLRKTK